MKFRVEWMPLAVNNLTAIWLAADAADRRSIAVAAQEVDRQLERDPVRMGESRPEGLRIMFNAPLAVRFRVLPRLSAVQVVQVWRTRPPRSHNPRVSDN